jgi:hypothetical protein
MKAMIRGLLTALVAASMVACGSQVQVTVKPAHPVRQEAKLTGTCTMGWMPTGQGAVFQSGVPGGPQVISGTSYYPAVGYEITLRDTGSSAAEVNGWAVAFYDTSGQELGSDQQIIGNTFITAGQSLSWTRYAPTDTEGNPDNVGSDSSIPANGAASTCQIVQWTHP